ncbi:MAG: arginine--tRNA ligase [Thermomicrobiales bacterium]|nr:MAG: arginine--tRNA ligase [Thermomicrobiales bacterium]
MSQLATKGVIAAYEERARIAIAGAVAELGLTPRGPIDLRPVPFAGTWGVASSISHALAGEAAATELERSGALEGLSKKESKKLTSERARAISLELAEQIAAKLQASGIFGTVEAANGYVNISFDPMVVASGLVSEVLTRGSAYGHGVPKTERVMVEHSQPNTHKVFHVGHLRNSVLGVSVSRILGAAGYPVMEATYPGDIGMHVIKCLWCYERFHLGQEPADVEARGAWIGQVYAESDARLEYRKDLIAFLQSIIKDDPVFVEAIDRLLKLLWREGANNEDIAYLLGRFSFGQELKDTDFRDDSTIVAFWPIVGQQLRLELENEKPYVEVEGIAPPEMTPGERLDRWEELNRNIAWWPHVPEWRDEVRQTFARWEAQEPALVALWQATRDWSLTDFRRIFDELEAHFDVWFFESEVEEPGKDIVKELVETGLAEISEGLTVVKIDEKLGLAEPVYRTLPILRSDGTSLYSTKDLALTKRKFEEFGIDRAVWVVDVRQSLYFKQIFKILELWGFEQAKQAYHLPYEIVTLPEGVISSRKGRAPLYDDVKAAVLQRAREIIEDKNPELPEAAKSEVAWQVGIGSIKYTMLARDNSKVVVFDLDEALSFDGHAAPYIQYAHARACRILENAGWDHDSAVGKAALGELTLDFGAVHPAELALLQQIAALPEEVQRAADQYRPLLIANYVYDLAKGFNDFYHACPVIYSDEPVRSARLALVDATRQTLANGLALLAIEAPSAM